MASIGADKFYVSQENLLGSWQDNIKKFKTQDAVIGIVRSLKGSSAFVEINPMLVGFIANLKPNIELKRGDVVSVIISHINFNSERIHLKFYNKVDNVSMKTQFEYRLQEDEQIHS